jgi:uncharacterized protein involved in high-affinity Fe2+ transport
MMKTVAQSDIHLEADIRAQADNANGFADGTWIPYLSIAYEITKAGDAQKITGELMPMVANDGPHYGDNVKLAGPGKYTLKLSIAPPGASAHAHFGRHTDKETGVGPWFKPFTLQYDPSYPVRVNVEYPEHVERWRALYDETYPRTPEPRPAPRSGSSPSPRRKSFSS